MAWNRQQKNQEIICGEALWKAARPSKTSGVSMKWSVILRRTLLAYHTVCWIVVVCQWQRKSPEWICLLVDHVTVALAGSCVHQFPFENLQVQKQVNLQNQSSQLLIQNMLLTSEAWGLMLFKMISRHSAASHCSWTAESHGRKSENGLVFISSTWCCCVISDCSVLPLDVRGCFTLKAVLSNLSKFKREHFIAIMTFFYHYNVTFSSRCYCPKPYWPHDVV